MTRKDDKGDQPSGEETTWTNTGATDMAGDSTRRLSWRRHAEAFTQPRVLRLPNDDDYDDDVHE